VRIWKLRVAAGAVVKFAAAASRSGRRGDKGAAADLNFIPLYIHLITVTGLTLRTIRI
jgi:hypothetical protein